MELRIVDAYGGLSSEGLLEVGTSQGFASVCGLSDSTAAAVCRALGYPGGSVGPACSSFRGQNICGTRGMAVAMKDLTCSGEDLSQCQWDDTDSACLDHRRDSTVQCDTEMHEGAVRLMEGGLEMWWHGAWAPVSQQGFSLNSALVACKSLGFAAVGAGPIEGSHQVANLQVECDGTEDSMAQCATRAGDLSEGVLLRCAGGRSKDVVASSLPLTFPPQPGGFLSWPRNRFAQFL